MDYDGWASEGLPDWDYAHCLPYFRLMETFADGPDDWRGGAPADVQWTVAAHKLDDAFLRGGEQAGFSVTPDHNGYRPEGLHVAQSFIDRGVRWSASRAYLRPALGRPNLKVLPRALARGGGRPPGWPEPAESSRRGPPVRRPARRLAHRGADRDRAGPNRRGLDAAPQGPRHDQLLRSADPADPPSIVFDHLRVRQDVKDLVAGVRQARTLIRQRAWDAYRGEELAPGPHVVSDAEIEASIRQRAGTVLSPVRDLPYGRRR